MENTESASIIPPSKTRPKTQNLWPSQWEASVDILRTNFSVSTWLLLGACLQCLLLVLLPSHSTLTLSAAVLLLSTRFISKCLVALGVLRNPAMADVMPKKTTAVLRDRDGKPAEKVAVLLLGFKSNHPFGIFAPGFKEIGDYFFRMSVELSEGAADNGFLGQTSWSSKDRPSQNPELLNISYWRDLDAVHAFAHGPLHREAWDYWNRTVKAHPHLGIHHEVFEADAGRWESVYANFQPTGLGATSSYLRRPNGSKGPKHSGPALEGGVGGGVVDEWVTPLLPANKGKLSTSVGRLGRGNGDENEKYGENVYL